MRQIILMAGLLLAGQAAQAAEAGKVIFVAGSARIADQSAVLGATVNEGELLRTGGDGYIYIKTIDKGLFILRPNTQARIATYHVDSANPANTRIKLELLSGVARSQSGEAVKLARQNFRFNTPVAAIGVRGTDFTVFTDDQTSRVAVISGGVTVSGFGGGCSPEGSGPCEGEMARDLSAAQKGQLLQIKRGQGPAQLMSGSGNLAPDVVAPPRSDEGLGKGGSASTLPASEPSLDPKKNSSLQGKAQAQVVPPEPERPVIVPPVVVQPEVPKEILPPREISWGRWTSVMGMEPNSALSKNGAERIALTDDFVLFRSLSGSQFQTPERGSVGFMLAGSEAYVRDERTFSRSAAKLENGQLLFNFDKRTFTTNFDLLAAGEAFKMRTDGNIGADGVFSGWNRNAPDSNMTVTGAMNDLNGAVYLFKGGLDSNRSASGVVHWKK